jgi:hypothetical protein
MNQKLQDRARRVREQELIRAWLYRQRNYSTGVWYRLRRVLVDAAQAWVIDECEADRLVGSGHIPLPVGNELVPPKRLFYMNAADLKGLSLHHQIAVRLSAELLQARSLVLVPHGEPESTPLRPQA